MTRICLLCLVGTLQFGLLASAAHADQVDYSRCAELFNNWESSEENPKGYRTKKSGPFVPERLRYFPFDLHDDGSISVHQGASLSRAGGNEVISYESPDIVALENLDTSIARTATRTVQVVIERNAQGHITSIVENRGLVADENQEIKRIEQWSGDPELAFAYRETRTTFGVFGGQCVPMKSEEIVVHNKDGQRQQTEIVVYDTKLCQRIERYLDDNGLSTLRKDAGIEEILGEHGKDFFNPDDSRADLFLSNDKVNELVNNELKSKHSKHDLRMQVLTGYATGTQLPGLRQQAQGVGPLVSAQMIVANCRYQGIGVFMLDSSLEID